jgi:hypothetical protein
MKVSLTVQDTELNFLSLTCQPEPKQSQWDERYQTNNDCRIPEQVLSSEA